MNEDQLLAKISYYETILARCPNEPHIADDLAVFRADLAKFQAAKASAQQALAAWEQVDDQLRAGSTPSNWESALAKLSGALDAALALMGVRVAQ